MRKTTRKAQFFEIDVLLAVVILVGGVILIKSFFIQPMDNPQINKYAYDAVNMLNTMPMGSLDPDILEQLRAQGVVFSENELVSRQIARLIIEDNQELAETLTEGAMRGIIPDNYGYSVYFKDETLVDVLLHTENGDMEKNFVSASRVLLTGLQQDEPVSGYTGSITLADATTERSSYYYFGGFIGQGNISIKLELPPITDINDFTEVYLEGGFVKDFNFYLNGHPCDYEQRTAHEHQNGDEGAQIVKITYDQTCVQQAQGGINDIRIEFTEGNLSQQYVSGGFAKISYETDTRYVQLNTVRKYLPGIKGAFNIYDSFYVPGELNRIDVHLDYKMNYTEAETSIFFSIADHKIHNDSRPVTSESITYNHAIPQSQLQQFSNKTVPFRFGFENATSTALFGGNADIILISDNSGSMKKATAHWGQGRSFPTPQCYSGTPDGNTRKGSWAKCLSLFFTDEVLSAQGNRLWPVFIYGNEIDPYTGNPSDPDQIKNFISGANAQGSGKTCLSCAVNKAYEILMENNDPSRPKFIVLMTDGVATHCADGSCESVSSDFGIPHCEGLCDIEGQDDCSPQDIIIQCDECTINRAPSDNLLFSAQRAVNDLDTTIFTIGFGPIDTCGLAGEILQEVADIGNGTYQQSSDVHELENIYTNISSSILSQLTLDDQVVVIDIPGESELFSNSYIEYSFTPYRLSPPAQSILLTMESNSFDEGSCNINVNIPGLFTPLDGRITSYSGRHWTDRLEVNNELVYDLFGYGDDYSMLGDPFMIGVPPGLLSDGSNVFELRVRDMNGTEYSCSRHNKLMYTAAIPSVFSLGTRVFNNMEGCSWTVQTVGTNKSVAIPDNYGLNGPNRCFYNSSTPYPFGVFNSSDGWQVLAFEMFSELDFDDSGVVDIDFQAANLDFADRYIDDIPYMWEPSVLEVVVWR